MPEVFPRDVLLRVNPRTLGRLPYTFSRAAIRRIRDRDGIGRKVAAGNVAINYPGLVDAFGNPVPTIRFDGARTQLVTDPENFGAWTNSGTPVITSGQADPFGGTAAYLIGDDNAAGAEGKQQTVVFTGDATKAVSVFMRQGVTPPAAGNIIVLTGAAERMRATVTWAAGVPSVVMSSGGVQLGTPEAWGNGWYRFHWQAVGVIATDTNLLTLYAANTAGTGDAYYFGANAWDAPFPSSYQGPGESAGAADSLTVPFNFGPLPEMTVLARVARAVHADASGSLGIFPYIFALGNDANKTLALRYDNTTRAVTGEIRNTIDIAAVTLGIPAGAEQVYAVQYENLAAGESPVVRLDVGTGFTSDTSTQGFATFANQTLAIGSGAPGSELYGDLIDLIVARGLFSHAEMSAIR